MESSPHWWIPSVLNATQNLLLSVCRTCIVILNIGQRRKLFLVALQKISQLLHIFHGFVLIHFTSLAKFKDETRTQKFRFGMPGIIHCSAVGNPSPQFTWKREDGRTLQNRRFIQLANGSLEVKSIQREDKGIFICTIKQSRGSDSTSEKSQKITVTVIGKIRKYIYIVT